MALLKIGMKVRLIANHKWGGERPPGLVQAPDSIIGHEGIIVGRDDKWWVVDIPTFPGSPMLGRRATEWDCLSSELAPLTPPDTWASDQVAKLKKLGREPMPKQTEEVHG